jgi:hypothetical protein
MNGLRVMSGPQTTAWILDYSSRCVGSLAGFVAELVLAEDLPLF